MPTAERKFVVVFKKVSSMKDGDQRLSPTENHSDIPWDIRVERKNEHLGIFSYCRRAKNGEEWAVEVCDETSIISKDGSKLSKSGRSTFKNTDQQPGWGKSEFIKWDEMIRDYVIDDTLTVEVQLTIKKTTGIEKKKLRNFDESMKESADVILVVEKKMFYVSKLFLAGQSPHFKTLFLKRKRSGIPKYTLTDVKASDFQTFLEFLYGDSPIDESTIDGILLLAVKFDAKSAIQKCEQFLIDKSEKTWKKKFEIAVSYELENLKDDIRSKITTDITTALASALTNDVIESLLTNDGGNITINFS